MICVIAKRLDDNVLHALWGITCFRPLSDVFIKGKCILCEIWHSSTMADISILSGL